MDFITQLFSGIFAGIITNKVSKQHIDNSISVNVETKVNLDATETTSNNGILTDCDYLKFRIVFAVDLLKRIDTEKRITSTAIASDLGLDDTEKVNNIVLGKVCPDVQFIKQFSKHYNINEEWLISGDSYTRKPYSHCSNFMHDATDIPNIYKNGQYTSMYVCTTDDDERWTCLVLVKSGTFMVAHCESNWRISSHVGCGGSMQLVALYKALTYFNSYSQNVYRLRISIDEFNKFISGEAHINEIKIGKRIDYMWEDFLDINRKNMGNLNYEEEYGAEFISAQNNVSYRINESGKS